MKLIESKYLKPFSDDERNTFGGANQMGEQPPHIGEIKFVGGAGSNGGALVIVAGDDDEKPRIEVMIGDSGTVAHSKQCDSADEAFRIAEELYGEDLSSDALVERLKALGFESDEIVDDEPKPGDEPKHGEPADQKDSDEIADDALSAARKGT